MENKNRFAKIISFFKTKKGKKVLMYVGIGIVVLIGVFTAAFLLEAGTVKLVNSNADAGKVSGGGRIMSGASTTVRAQAYKGYRFLNWTNEDGSFASDEAEYKLVVPKSNLRLTANWELIEYPLTLNLDGGTGTYPASVNIKSDTLFLDAPTKEGYTFLGWYKDAEFKEEADDFIPEGTTDPVTLYAQWALSYEVTYQMNGASNNPDNPDSYTAYKNVELKDPVYYETQDGALTGGSYRFLGWRDQDTGEVVDSLLSSWERNVHLEAMWDMSKAVYYTIQKKGNATYVEFGRYPQHVLEDKRTVAELNAKIADGTLVPDASGVYNYNNVLYVKAKADPYRNDAKTYFSTFSDGADIEKDKEYYFIVEPITWRVLSGDPTDPNSEVVLLAENVLTSQVFRKDKTVRTTGGLPIYANNWEYSDLRTFLNDTFLNEAFMTGEQDFLVATTVNYGKETSNKSKYVETGATCEDKVYLLSFQDMKNEAYGWSSGDGDEDGRKTAKATDYAKALGVYSSLNGGNEYDAAHWWLRSSGDLEKHAALTTALGSLASSAVDGKEIGVRPAVTVKFN